MKTQNAEASTQKPKLEDPMISSSHRLSRIARAHRRSKQAGAAMVEYSLLLFAVMICAAGAIKMIGPAVVCAGISATDDLGAGISGGGGCLGATASSGSSSGAASGGSATSAASTGGGSTGEDSTGGTGGSSSSGDVASAGGDDGTGGFLGGSGSSGSGSSAGGSGSATSGANSGSDDSSANGGVASNSSSGSSGTSGAASFSSQVAGTAPKAIDLTLAKLANDVYGGNGAGGNGKPMVGADGFTPVSAADLAKAGITQSMLSDPNSLFQAQVYTNGKGQYVIAYRGTVGALNGPGWATDAAQATGHATAQYSEAMRLGAAAKAAWGNNVVVTGHSLGGGEAAAVAAGTGLTGVTFNAAGVNDATLARENVNASTARDAAYNGQVRSYEVQGEALSTAQNALSFVAPQALGRPITIQDPNPRLTAVADLNPISATARSVALHGEYLDGMEAKPVIYKGANGQASSYSFSNPNNPS